MRKLEKERYGYDKQINFTSYTSFLVDKSNTSMLKFSPEDQDQDKWNEFVSSYILKCEDASCVAKNLNWLSNIREPIAYFRSWVLGSYTHNAALGFGIALVHSNGRHILGSSCHPLY